jgi:hypothetical protein
MEKKTRVVLGIWDVPLSLAGGVSYPLVVDELFRDQPRLDRDQLITLGLRELPGGDELEPDVLVDFVVREWRATLRPFRRQLERAVGGHIELDRKQVERRAQSYSPPYRLREYTRRNGTTAFAQVVETLEQRIGAELVDLLRIAPKVSRCPYCERIYVRPAARGCGGFLAQGPTKVEDCLGRPMRPRVLAPEEERERHAMGTRLWRWTADWGADDPRVVKLRRKYEEKFPPRRRGPRSFSGSYLLP